MAFKFRYESLLVYRNHLKEKAEMDLARANRNLKVSKQGLTDLVEDRKRVETELETDLGAAMDAGVMKGYVDYLSHMADRIRVQRDEVLNHEKTVRQERKQLLLRTKQYNIMENLKEKDRAKWMLEQERKERIQLNEIAVLRHRSPQR